MGILREMVRAGDSHPEGEPPASDADANDAASYTAEALVKIMFRIRDEEESIQQLVVDIFRERWFAGDVASQDRRAHELMLVVWQVFATLKSQVSPCRGKHPRGSRARAGMHPACASTPRELTPKRQQPRSRAPRGGPPFSPRAAVR
jgi:hypothetical protein